MRDLKKAIQSSHHKVRLFGLKNFFVKVFEVCLLTVLSKVKFRLKPSKRNFLKVIDLKFFIDSASAHSEEIKIEKLVLKGIFEYKYTIFNKVLSFESEGKIHSKLYKLKHILLEDEYEKILNKFGDYSLHKWNYDPVHKYSFEQLTIPYDRAEIKIPWELGRFSYYPQLSIHSQDLDMVAFVFSRDIISFACENGCTDHNVQWANAMEAGIRIFNILVTSSVLKQRGVNLSDEVEKIICSLVDLHIKYILFNNEFSFIQTSNHYAANILGLAAINTQINNKCLNLLLRRSFKFEVKRNTNNCFLTEGSTAYHRFTSEIYYSTYLLLRMEGTNTSDYELEKIFVGMAGIIKSIENPLGLHSQFGDADGGFLNWYAFPYSKSLERFTPYVVDNYVEYVNLIFSFLRMSEIVLPKSGIVSFLGGDSLILINDEDSFLLINNIKPQKGVYNKTHFHDDHGYIEYFKSGVPIVVDSGTYCYTSDLKMRSRFQSSESHYNNRDFFQVDNPFADFVRLENTIAIKEEGDNKIIAVNDSIDGSNLLNIVIYNSSFTVELSPIFRGKDKSLFVNYLDESINLEFH